MDRAGCGGRASPARVPPAPRFTDGWQFGPPDLVVSMPEAFEVPASGPDIFRNFVVPIADDRRRYVRAWEFRPGNTARRSSRDYRVRPYACVARARRSAMARRDTKAWCRSPSRTRTAISSAGRLDSGSRSGPCHECRGPYQHRPTSCSRCTFARPAVAKGSRRVSACISPTTLRMACRSRFAWADRTSISPPVRRNT